MFTVARDLGMIVSNTDALTRRIEATSDALTQRIDSVDANNTYIRGKVDEHSEKLGELTERTQRLESSFSHMKGIPT